MAAQPIKTERMPDASNLPSNYRGLHTYRLASNPTERLYAERWAEINKTGHVLEYILSIGGEKRADPSPRDYAVAATVVQWLGTIVGQSFLEEVARRASSPERAATATKTTNSEVKPAETPALSVVFSDPGMKDKTVPVSSKGGSLTKILRAEEKARNYTTAKIQHGGVTIATLYRPLGSMSFQTVPPDPEDR